MADPRREVIDPHHKPLPVPVVVSMDRYGSVANKAWFCMMSGKLWKLTEKPKERK